MAISDCRVDNAGLANQRAPKQWAVAESQHSLAPECSVGARIIEIFPSLLKDVPIMFRLIVESTMMRHPSRGWPLKV